MDPDQDELHATGGTSQLGRRAQVGGAIALVLGLMLTLLFPQTSAGAPLDLHQMAKLFIAFGLFLLALGTGIRGFFAD